MADVVQVQEGGSLLWVPRGHTQHGPAPRASALGLFYNRAAARNRDVSVLYMSARHGCSDRHVLDALAGSGARGVRWAVEAKLGNVTLNDRSPEAARTIQRNLEANYVTAQVVQRDVHALLAEECFRHIELDPYGTPAPFLDAAMRSLGREGGVSFTATDTAALCGANAKPCLRRYGAVPTRVEELCHEAGLRILIAHAVREAAKHDQAALPVLSTSREHYLRVYVETRRLSQLADQQLKRIHWLIHCPRCLHRGFDDAPSRSCPACGGAAQASGPMWSGPLWNAELLRHMEHLRPNATLALPRHVGRDLELWAAEQDAGGLPWHLQDVASFAGVAEPPRTDRLVQELRRMGHPASGTHLDGRFVRTPAPAKDVVQAVREAARSG